MTIDPDVSSKHLTRAWEHLLSAMPDSWCERRGSVLTAATMVPMPTLNGVWVDERTAEVDAVADALDRVAATGLPHCLQVRADCVGPLGELAHARGLGEEEEIPLMVLTRPTGRNGATAPLELEITVLAPEHALRHARTAAAGFQAPEEHFARLLTPAVLALPGVTSYVGEVEGETVATALSVTVEDSVGVFNVATLSGYRRRGYGAAMTARAVRDAFAAGARWAWLQSSPDGLGLYERMGFATVESWRCWYAAN